MTHGSNQWEDFDWKNEECEVYKKHLEGFVKFIKEIINSKPKKEKEVIDKWIESRINRIIQEVTDAMDKNEIKKAINSAFFSILNDISWYKKRTEKYNPEIVSSWLKLLTPFTPHICEELWHEIGNENSILLEDWPPVDTEVINMRIEAGEELIKNLLKDINEVKRLSKIEKPKKITIFVAPAWKHEVFDAVLQVIELKEIIKNYKGKEKEVSDYYKNLQKKKPLEEKFLKGHELKYLLDAKEFLEKEIGCEIEIISAEKSDHSKALVAEPEKPGIFIE